MAQHSIKIELRGLPPYHSTGSDIYIAGSFNGWNAEDPAYRFGKDGVGHYSITFSLADGNYAYKITRGGWDKVECKKDGEGIDNRSLTVSGDTSLQLDIEEWIDRFPAKPKASTAGKNVHILQTDFFIPQLKRTRRIWIYLPENYAHSKDHYPVLYMQDGQNIFDEATAYAGEWGIDDYFDRLYEKGIQSIVVAADNGGAKRMNEYNPYDTKKFGKGEGKAYVDFMVKTLKPFVDNNYRTLKDKAHTSIAGSSLGGLISLYAVLQYPGIFGSAAIFSPALWLAPKIFADIRRKGGKVKASVYFYAGKQEDEAMVTNTIKAFEAMNQVSASALKCVIRDDGTHSEASWGREFPLFYEWHLQQQTKSIQEPRL